MVLFDADGTLLDFLKSEAEAVREALVLDGIVPTDETVSLYSDINSELWRKLERGEIEKKVLLYRRFELLYEVLGARGNARLTAERYMSALATKGYMLKGAEDMLRALYGRVKMYIVTNGVEFIQRGRYARCGMEKYFENIFISDVIGVEKPDVRYFEYVDEHIGGIDKKRTLIVGDSLTSDIRGGINYGIDTCWYNPAGKPCPDGMNITFIADSFDSVVKFITDGDSI